jgi:TatD family-associated radical SAM protein
MEENKNVNNQNPQANGQNAGGRRRRRRRKNKGGNGGAQNTQNTQVAQNNQNAQNGGNQGGKSNGQNAGKPNNQNGGKGNNQNAQNQQNNQNQQKPKQNQNQSQNQSQNNQNNQKQGNKQNGKGGQKEENRKDTYAYILDGNLYINLTNKCSNGCDFCVRNERASYYGNYLWLKNGDPSAEAVIAQVRGMGDLSRFKEVVFCGFGEPTYKVKEMVELCDYFHEKGLSTRLNTNGQGNLINKRDIVPELKGKIDFVNVSLNASCAEKYQPICRSQYGENGFAALVEFAKICKRNGVNCRFSIVDCIGEEEVEACKRLAASVNIPLYVRTYIADS